MTAEQKKRAQGIALLEAGIPPGQVMDILKVTDRTVRRWVADAEKKGHDLRTVVRSVVQAKKEAQFVEALETYMEEAFVTFTEHLKHARSKEWFEKQDPDKVAVFDGVHADKVFKVLDAIAEHQRHRDGADTGAVEP